MSSKFILWLRGSRAEDGQAMVLVAISLVVILGFGAFAVDIGHVTVQKSDLQNAADAAALAGVVELPSSANAVSKAVTYAQNNGMAVAANNVALNGEKVTVTNLGNNQLKVECSRTVDYYFAGVLGFDSKVVTAVAVAEKKSEWAGEALPFINLDDDYTKDVEIVAWEKVAPGDKESIDNFQIINQNDPETCYFKVDYLNGVELKKGTVATIKQEVGYVYDQNKPDGHVYVISLSSTVMKNKKVLLKDGTIRNLSGLKNNDIVDPSQLVLLECIFHDYDYQGKTLYFTVVDVFDIGHGELPPDYQGADAGHAKLVQ